MEHPIEPPPPTPPHLPVQRVLTGLDVPGVATPRRQEAVVASASLPAAAGRQKGRRRYLSIRDLSRRLWLGRGYDLLRALIHSGILPATRSARSWWIEDADVSALHLAFDDRAGKVRAFGGLAAWLRQRCWVVPAAPEAAPDGQVEAAPSAQPSIFHWRGAAYLPQRLWRMEPTPEGGLRYRHQSGATFASGATPALAG